jgi:hypothetical protein
MSESLLIWSVPVAIAFHNLEEAIWLPRWSNERAGRWHPSVGPWPFRFAVVILTAIAFLVAAMAQFGGSGSLGHYLLGSYALGQAINVFLPHAVATIATRTYAPGLLTGIVFVLPTAFIFLTHSFTEDHLQTTRFLIVAAVFILLLLFSIPVLFQLGRLMELHVHRHAA